MGNVKISQRQLISLLVLIRMTPQSLNCTTLNIVRTPQIGLIADVIGTALSVPLVYLVARASAGAIAGSSGAAAGIGWAGRDPVRAE